MGSTNFYYTHPADNVASSATPSVETGSAATGYEATYLTDITDANRQRPAKLTSTTGAWVLDWGAAQRVDLVVLWHNFDAALANVKIQMNAANSWGAPTLTTTVVPPAKYGDGGTVKIFKDMRTVSGYSASGFRYLRVALTTANSVNLGLKVLCFSGIRTTTRFPVLSQQEPQTRPGILLPTEFDPGAWAYDLAVASRRIRGTIAASDADRLLLRTWFEACGGNAKVTCLVPDPEDTAKGAWLARWTSNGEGLVQTVLDSELAHQNITNIPFSFDEVTAGGPEWT